MKKELKHDKKISYLMIGMNLSGIAVSNRTADFIIRLYEGILEKGDDFSIMYLAKIQAEIEKKYDNLQRKRKKRSKSK